MGLKRALCCGVWTILRLRSVLAYFAIGYVFKSLRLHLMFAIPVVCQGYPLKEKDYHKFSSLHWRQFLEKICYGTMWSRLFDRTFLYSRR